MPQAFSLLGKCLLVVDDEEFSRTIIVRMLDSMGGPKVHRAASGVDALEQLRTLGHEIAAVVSDINMCLGNGLELLKAIRTGVAGVPRDLPVILLTGNADQELVGLALSLDANAFVVKPASKKALSARLARVLTAERTVAPVDQYAAIDVSNAVLDRLLPVIALGGSGQTRAAAAEMIATAAQKALSLTAGMTGQPPTPVQYSNVGVSTRIDRLIEDAVLARDVCSAEGMVLLSAGTVLTRGHINRLRALADLPEPIEYVWLQV